MERLKSMKECLTSIVQGQMGDLHNVDTKELGEAVDMIKDLAEAIYYCTITEAMEHPEKENRYYSDRRYPDYRDMDREYGKMYYDERMTRSDGGANSNKNTMYYKDMMPMDFRDYREGRSPRYRKNYIESKENHHSQESQIKELEKYMKELTTDITEMIEDATPEQKQMLKQKMTVLMEKLNNV